MKNFIKSLFYNRKEKSAILEMLWDLKTAFDIVNEFPGAQVMCITTKEKFYNSFEKKKVNKKIVVGWITEKRSYVLYDAFKRTGYDKNQITEKWELYTGEDFIRELKEMRNREVADKE